MRNRCLRRSVSILSALALLGTMVMSYDAETAQAATKAKLKTKKKITIMVGEKKTIKLKKKAKGAKYTFKSKNKKVATVSKKGVVKGIKKGKTVITVKEKTKNKKAGIVGKVTVTVQEKTVPAQPTSSVQPTASAQPTASVQPTNPAQPTNAAQPTSSAQPTEPAETSTPDPSKLVLTGEQVKPTTEDERASYTLNEDGTVTVNASWKYYAIAFSEPLDLSTVKSVHIKGSASNGFRLSFGNKDGEYFIDHENLDSWVYPAAFDGETTIDLTNNSPSGKADWLFLGTKSDDVTFNIESITFTIGKPAAGEISTDGLTEAIKQPGKNNPIAPQRFMADPFAIEYNGTVYVYGTNDSANMRIGEDGKIPYNDYSQITSLNCYSSKDMVNWTDEGIIPVSGKKGPASWAKNSWAPAVAYKNIDGKDKFFIYFADNGSGIGVLEGDSPTGPFRDPIGKQLISRDTPNCSGEQVPWLFDPAVFVDDDGQGYLYFGGIGEHKDSKNPKCQRVVKLGDDMISLAEDPVEIDSKAPFEDAGINKIGDKYYFSYCTNWESSAVKEFGLEIACIAYMTSDSPMGPWSAPKMVMKNPTSYFSGLPSNNNNNNHHCMLMRNGTLYMFYHSQKTAKDMGNRQGYRTTGVDVVTIDENGDLTCSMTERGVQGDSDFNPYDVVEAETFAWANGVSTLAGPEQDNTRNNRVLSSVSKGDYVGLDKVAFGEDGAQSLTMQVKSEDGETKEGTIGIYIDGREEENKVGEIEISAGDDYKDVSAVLAEKITGTHRLFFVFDIEGIYVDTWSFSKDAEQQ